MQPSHHSFSNPFVHLLVNYVERRIVNLSFKCAAGSVVTLSLDLSSNCLFFFLHLVLANDVCLLCYVSRLLDEFFEQALISQ